MKIAHATLADRLLVIGAVCAGYLGAFVPIMFLGRDGVWLAKLLFLSGMPFLALAITGAAVFAASIKAHPWKWSLAAATLTIIASTIGLWFLAGSLIGLIGLMPALIAPAIFRGALKACVR